VSTFYITTSKGMRGHYSLMVEVDAKGFAEPHVSGEMSYSTKEEAEQDAREWAEAEGLEYKACKA